MRTTPIRAIREKCLDCCAGNKTEVRLCPSASCSLHPYRLGHNPNIQRKRLQRTKTGADDGTGATIPVQGKEGKYPLTDAIFGTMKDN